MLLGKTLLKRQRMFLMRKASELLLHSLGCSAVGWHQGLEASKHPGDSRAEKVSSTPAGASCLIFLKMPLSERFLIFQCIPAPAYPYFMLSGLGRERQLPSVTGSQFVE